MTADESLNHTSLEDAMAAADQAAALIVAVSNTLGLKYKGPQSVLTFAQGSVVDFCCEDSWYAAEFAAGCVTIYRIPRPEGKFGSIVASMEVPGEYPAARAVALRKLPTRNRRHFWDRSYSGWIGLIVILLVILVPVVWTIFFRNQ